MIKSLPIPQKPGYYWARWMIASDGTIEGDELTPAHDWEIVQVVDNGGDPKDIEYLMVSVPGVQRSQSSENFCWGELVATNRESYRSLPPMNSDLEAILGRPNFQCSPLAEILRKRAKIPRKAEAEQAYVLHYLLSFYLKDPVNWRSLVDADFQQILGEVKP